jgi:hypothetical protein
MGQGTWTLADERDFRRAVLVDTPELASRLAPWPAADWLAAMTIRELAPPPTQPYTGPERRKDVRVMRVLR